jgi:hypothetical protein
MKKAPYFIAVYVLVALFTFGHAFNNRPPTTQAWGQMRPTTDADRFFAGAASGIFWPMYLSVKFFEKQPEAKQ